MFVRLDRAVDRLDRTVRDHIQETIDPLALIIGAALSKRSMPHHPFVTVRQA
jgi:hypothetical protein